MTLINRENCINSICFALSALETYIKGQAKFNLVSSNVVAESFYAIFFNALYELNLQNLNLVEHNAKSIDLIDDTQNEIVQVTSNNRKNKLLETLKGCDTPKYKGYHLRMIIIARSGNSMKSAKIGKPAHINFNQDCDVVDLEQIKREISLSTITIDKLIVLNDIVTKNIGVILKPENKPSHLRMIIDLLAKQEMESECQETYSMDFDIREKIQFNNLMERLPHIKDIATYETMLINAFNEYDKFAKYKSQYIVAAVRRIQTTAPSSLDGVGLYDYIISELLKKFEEVSGDSLPQEELAFYADLLVVYAFVNCKIFKSPKLKI